MKGLVVLMLLVAYALAACPANCHGNGSCLNNVCQCNDDWAGSDCSIPVREVASGELIEDDLSTFTWNYYQIRVPSDANALNITVHQTNTFGDVDVFVQRGALPTHSSNLASDTSTSSESNILVEPAPPGTYFVGTYAYFYVSYEIKIDILTTCTVHCGSHGNCVHDACVCEENYTGSQCEMYDEEISSSAVVNNDVVTGEFKYFHLNVQSGHALNVVVEQSAPSPGCDVDVYLRANSYPTQYEFDAANATRETVTYMTVADPAAGVWYIGIYGYRGCSFTMNVISDSSNGCRSECSHHGRCSHNSCSCDRGYSGNLCERKDDRLENLESEDGYVSNGVWNYYTFQANSANNVDIHVHQTSSTADCDLYVANGRDPSLYDFDYADVSYDQDFDVIVSQPSTDVWTVGVYGWTECEYTLTMSIPTACPCVEGHGACAPGSALCMCYQGYTGPDCGSSTEHIDNGEVLDDVVGSMQWKYYGITTTSNAMLISMRERETTGMLWLFVGMSGFPNLDAYDFADKESNTNFHEVHYLFPTVELRTYFIGVYGSPYTNADEVPFTITAWSPEFSQD